MSLINAILSAISGQPGAAGEAGANPLQGALSSLLAQNGGLQGLMGKFSQGGLGEVFSSWVGMGENKAISADQIQKVLGLEEVMGLASALGVDPAEAGGFLSEYLPKIIDKLSPSGQVDDSVDHGAGLSALLPALLAHIGGGGTGKPS